MGEKLKALRKAAQLTQVEASKRIGVSQATVAMWEAGRIVPRTTRLAQIVAVYGCTITDLLSDTGTFPITKERSV